MSTTRVHQGFRILGFSDILYPKSTHWKLKSCCFSWKSGGGSIFAKYLDLYDMETNFKMGYISPVIDQIEFSTEGILCTSESQMEALQQNMGSWQ